MMIKVCGITRHEDAVVAAEAGASAIGFIFYPRSTRYITPARAAAVGEGLSLLRVGVFVDESAAAIDAAMRAAHIDVAQIYGGSTTPGTRVWKGFRVADAIEPNSGIEEAVGGCEAILLDGIRSGVPFDWRLARGIKGNVIVAGGLNPANVTDAIRIAQPWGVDASSSLESAPGIKDHPRVRAFVKAALSISGEATY
jgi:phosphoribosylanthranilate isomerase